jgi:organic hydroperoxide reductase OsmC/OhrA
MAHQYTATVLWERGDAVFTDNRYSRGHEWRFDGGVVVPASSSPLVVRAPLSREDAVDPEEAFVASLSSCHMLFFLSFVAAKGVRVDRYVDHAVGTMGRNARGKTFVERVVLRPQLTLSGGRRPEPGELDALHHRAHEECFIANSVLTEVVVDAPEPHFA